MLPSQAVVDSHSVATLCSAMLISEIFHSVQGEGILAGMPSVFIRTSGCNLRCQWCDTPYASWNPEGTQMSVSQIMAKVAEYDCKHIVVTGGEPMVAPEIGELLQALKRQSHHVTIETAGTIPPTDTLIDLASLSPKLSHSTPSVQTAGEAWSLKHERLRLQPDVLKQWCDSHDYQLKFVVASRSDLEELKSAIESIGIDIPPERVLLMPEGLTTETLKERQAFIIEACKQRGYRYSPRLHIDLFGNTRGT